MAAARTRIAVWGVGMIYASTNGPSDAVQRDLAGTDGESDVEVPQGYEEIDTSDGTDADGPAAVGYTSCRHSDRAVCTPSLYSGYAAEAVRRVASKPYRAAHSLGVSAAGTETVTEFEPVGVRGHWQMRRSSHRAHCGPTTRCSRARRRRTSKSWRR